MGLAAVRRPAMYSRVCRKILILPETGLILVSRRNFLNIHSAANPPPPLIERRCFPSTEIFISPGEFLLRLQIDNTNPVSIVFNFQENISGFVAITFYAISNYEIMIFFIDIVKVEDAVFSDF